MPTLHNLETGAPENLSQEAADHAVASGTHQIILNSPDGEPEAFDLESARAALSQGYTQPNSKQLDSLIKTAKYDTAGQQAKTFLEGAGEAATFGLSTAAERALGVDPAEIRNRREANPNVHMAGQITGLVGSSIALPGGGATGLMAKAGEGAAEAAGLAKAGSFLGKAGSTATKMGVENALMQSGDEASKYFSGDPNQTAETAMADIGLATALGAVGGAGLSAAGQGLSLGGAKLARVLGDIKGDATGAPSLFKKTLSVLGGVSEKDINNYIENRETIRNMPGFEEIHDDILGHVQSIHDAVAAGEASAKDAKEAFKDLQSRVKDEFRQKGFDASEANKAAKLALDEARHSLKTNLESAAINSSGKVAEAANVLRERVISGSQDAFEVLEQHPEAIPLEPLYNKVTKLQGELESRASPEANAMADKLGKYAESIRDTYGEYAQPAKVKKVIQGLDQLGKYDFNASAFDKGMGAQYNQIRYAIDDALKEAIPAYREAMKPVAEEAGLLKKLSRYGTEEDAGRAIKGIKEAVRFKNEMPLLRELEEKTGVQFADDIHKYADPARREALEAALPEQAHLERVSDVVAKLKNPETFKSMEAELNQSPEALRYNAAQAELEKAAQAKESLNGITPNNLESRLKAAGRGKLSARGSLEGLPQVEGLDPAKAMELMNTRAAFERGAMNGSRNVNMYAGALGAITGGLPGAGLGATLGGVMDKYGPQVVQKILDAYLDRMPVGSLVGESNRPALRLALAKMIDGGGEVSAAGFKSMVSSMAASIRGDEMATKAAKAIATGQPTKIEAPSEREMTKLRDRVEELSKDPSQLLNQPHDVGQYMPEQSTAMASATARALQYLQSIKPSNERANPLDPEPVVSKVDQAKYDRQLMIAQKPLLALQRIKEGSIIPDDVRTIATIYPSLYQGLKAKLMNAVVEANTEGKTIPYATKMGISLFTGMHLDTTMTSQGMQAIAIANAPPPPMQPPQGGRPKGSMKALDKTASTYQTATQARASDRMKA